MPSRSLVGSFGSSIWSYLFCNWRCLCFGRTRHQKTSCLSLCRKHRHHFAWCGCRLHRSCNQRSSSSCSRTYGCFVPLAKPRSVQGPTLLGCRFYHVQDSYTQHGKNGWLGKENACNFCMFLNCSFGNFCNTSTKRFCV